MPKCADCEWLDKDHCKAHDLAKEMLKRPLPPPPNGACMVPIVLNYLKQIGPGMKVLEVGCGSWDLIRSHCEKVGAVYEGIDPQAEYFGVKSVATRIENLAALSYPEDTFDFVIGNQTMEHWGEYGCSLEWGLYQCFRVCKRGGKVLLNIPIHFHGTKEFTLGKIEKLKNIYKPFSSDFHFESWGNPSAPLAPLLVHQEYWVLKNKPSYVVDIQAVKNKPLPKGYSNWRGLSGKVSQLVNYPVSFTVFRVARKLGFVPKPVANRC